MFLSLLECTWLIAGTSYSLQTRLVEPGICESPAAKKPVFPLIAPPPPPASLPSSLKAARTSSGLNITAVVEQINQKFLSEALAREDN